MTRFARAKGSKSSNKREPEEATPWSQMKEGLINKTAIINNAYAKQEEVQKHKDIVKNIKEENSNAVRWSTFDEDNGDHSKPKKEKKKKKKDNQELETVDNEKKTKKKKKVKVEENLDEVESEKIKIVKKAKKRRNDERETISVVEVECKGEKKIKKKKNADEESEVKVKEGFEKNEIPKIERNIEKKGGFPLLSNLSKKKKDGFKTRRKPVPEPFKMDINGAEVDIVRYDGFPVMKSDADRLDELKKKLFSKGISKDEIKKIMKLERRNAEKALSRAKKRVCFNCRKSGHNLSECPVLNQGEGTGICFKCGSTEHTHFECKVVKKQDFKFAQCFICKEQGHISNQCPDNPRGLYPKGGACKLCGDVTHLKRFCPTLPKETDVTIDSFLGDKDDNSAKKTETNQFGNQTKKHVRF